jgi:hypothetical protein
MLEVNRSKYAKQEKQAGVDITLPDIPKELLDQFFLVRPRLTTSRNMAIRSCCKFISWPRTRCRRPIKMLDSQWMGGWSLVFARAAARSSLGNGPRLLPQQNNFRK